MPILNGSATPHAAKKRKLEQLRDDPQLEGSEETGVPSPLPQPRPTKGTKKTFEDRKPTKIEVIGSFPVKLSVKGTSSVDMAITMPYSIFQDKDYLNNRIFHKRAYYLARIV